MRDKDGARENGFVQLCQNLGTALAILGKNLKGCDHDNEADRYDGSQFMMRMTFRISIDGPSACVKAE
jgi:hypothetical protein